MGSAFSNRLDAMSRRWATSDGLRTAALERLSTGLRIRSAADDAAGLGIAERMHSQSAGALRAERNVQDGIGALQTIDSVLGEVHAILQRARELAVQHEHGGLSSSDRAAVQAEATALGNEVARLTAGARFNGIALLSGGELLVQAGSEDADGISASLPDLAQLVAADVFTLSAGASAPGGGGSGSSGGTGNPNNGNGNGGANGTGNGNGNGGPGPPGKGGGSTKATPPIVITVPAGPPIARVDAAIDAISQHRSSLGAFQNRLEYARSTLATTHEQLVAAESRIRDADVAAEVVSLARYRLRSEVNRALAAQAHVDARKALTLLAA
jgi:flagellin